MLKRVTMLVAAILMLPALKASAQDPQVVTVRQIQEIPEENEDQLMAAGAALTRDQITALIRNELYGDRVQFTGVVLTDPRFSGLGSVVDGRVNRVHVWVRDTSAASLGNEGMTIQVVAGNYDALNLLQIGVGDVVTVVGTVSIFGGELQLAPESMELLGSYTELGLPESLVQPVAMTTAELNRVIQDDDVQVNWEDFDEFRHQYVRFENATVVARTTAPTGRPNWLISTDGGVTVVPITDTSLRYRNDRANYPEPFQSRQRDTQGPEGTPYSAFTPPPVGSIIDVEGYLALPLFDAFGRSVPSGALISLAPWTDEDLTVKETPPQITNISRPTALQTPSAPTTITGTVTADVASGRTLTEVVLKFAPFGTAADQFQSIAGTSTGAGGYSFEIPAQAEGTFVSYYVQATDSEGGVSVTEQQYFRSLAVIDDIADIQTTPNNGFGNSGLTGVTADMDLTVTVMSDPRAWTGGVGTGNNMFIAQDDPELGPWSGIQVVVPANSGLEPGDVIRITNAQIEEAFDVTRLNSVTFVTVSTDGAAYGDKVLTTAQVQDRALAESLESMIVRFEDVTVVNDSLGNGEWSFRSTGAQNNQTVIGDADADDTFTGLTNAYFFTNYEDGDRLEFVRGLWYYSFNAFKVEMLSTTDIGAEISTAVGEEVAANGYALRSAFPNPARQNATIAFQVARPGDVRLEVYDLLGRKVSTLVDGQLAAGSHVAKVDAKGLASGVYVYRLTAGSTVLTRTFIVVK